MAKLNRQRQNLAVEYMPLVSTLAGYFLQHRPAWQRQALRDDLEGEGYLALCKAARTYDPKRLPYAKAYLARAILNSMYKWIKRGNRSLDGERVPMDVAADRVGIEDDLDHLGQAIAMLSPESQLFASDRFEHGLPLKRTSQRARRIALLLAKLLDIQLPAPREDRGHPRDCTKSEDTDS